MGAGDPVWTEELLDVPHEAADKAGRVRRMFDAIAPRYELVNTVFSAGRDRYWRRRAVALSGAGVVDEVLDVACGTGDFARSFAAAGCRRVVGCDFAAAMLRLAAGRSGTPLRWLQADALHLPFADRSFSVVSCAFGVRNLQDLGAGLAEMHRVLRPGGRAVILEFTRPDNAIVRCLYEFYAGRLMPWGASLVARDRTGAYRYLPKSVVSFPGVEAMQSQLRRAGFSRSSATPLTFGIVTVYVAVRDSPERY
ncbi:MAG: bifunctional demethylmenaquinone methyltransferase/2-methoxy-6-polyprenyl-1,4-benzoquinol methylase UbiE [Planctomycetes bacterium]|nr:bifunctional demethylmenaquinone methyltransferase/2-methoxy-6-polyprenyl-1,4-benzoquinol methylase UbiE [Planctomycetota bacterium]